MCELCSHVCTSTASCTCFSMRVNAHKDRKCHRVYDMSACNSMPWSQIWMLLFGCQQLFTLVRDVHRQTAWFRGFVCR